MSWQDRAACKGQPVDLFFPESGGDTRPAKRICAGCEVQAECLDFALRHYHTPGIWGGKSERERRPMRNTRASNIAS